jgi:hypothetical protein
MSAHAGLMSNKVRPGKILQAYVVTAFSLFPSPECAVWHTAIHNTAPAGRAGAELTSFDALVGLRAVEAEYSALESPLCLT